jgi:membrane protease YdiL (CAAX protease family)
MTITWARPAAESVRPILRPVLLTAGLLLAVAVRWAAVVSVAGDGVEIGLAFGIGLLGVAFVGGQRLTLTRTSSVAIGVAGGGVLVGLALFARVTGPAMALRPAVDFLPWALATILVATAEELVLRGVLFDALARVGGVATTVVLTSVLFALIHVPLYGWHVVPLDLGVGLWLAGLRLLSGGVAAPAIAHTLADLATWWL